ncbi:MAG: MFS transporter, partial [Candidatus Methanomethylophilaceae archaeon]|nr:MFS transporter [Candidatus Methanomethylophilaceae archaeon]
TGAERVKVIGYQSAAIGAGTLVLETIGGSQADIGWNYPFLIYLIGLLIIILGIFSVREPVHAKNHSAETSRKVPAGKVLFCYITVFAEMFMMFSMPTCFSYYIPEVLPGMTGTAGLLAGILLGVTGMSQAFFSLFYSRSSSKMSETGAYSCAFVLMAAGMALMYAPVFIPGQTLTLAVLAASMVSVGFSLGLLMPSVVGSLARLSTPETSGKIMGGYAVFLNISTFSAGITVPMLCGILGSGYVGVFGLLALVSAVLSAVSAFKRMAERRSAQP